MLLFAIFISLRAGLAKDAEEQYHKAVELYEEVKAFLENI